MQTNWELGSYLQWITTALSSRNGFFATGVLVRILGVMAFFMRQFGGGFPFLFGIRKVIIGGVTNFIEELVFFF